jgi:hypothetical protein
MRKFKYLILALSIIACKKDIQSPQIIQGKKILIAFQNSKSVHYFLVDSQKLFFLFNSGDVPNAFVKINDNEFYLINSGGFSGSPSIQKFNFLNGEVITYPLNNNYNPMFGVYSDGRLFITDFGKFYSENVLVFKDGQILDSIKTSNRPIDIQMIDSFLIVSTNGMKADYSYDIISKIFKISTNSLEKIDSLKLFPGASNIGVYKDTIFIVSTGIYNQTPSRIYKINKNFQKLDSLTISKNIFSFALNSDYLVLGSWDGWIYVLNHNLVKLDSLKISNSINFICSFEDKFYITANGFSYNPNYLIIYKPFLKAESIKLLYEDVGIGPCLVF